jgi:hypothetical protein
MLVRLKYFVLSSLSSNYFYNLTPIHVERSGCNRLPACNKIDIYNHNYRWMFFSSVLIVIVDPYFIDKEVSVDISLPIMFVK